MKITSAVASLITFLFAAGSGFFTFNVVVMNLRFGEGVLSMSSGLSLIGFILALTAFLITLPIIKERIRERASSKRVYWFAILTLVSGSLVTSYFGLANVATQLVHTTKLAGL